MRRLFFQVAALAFNTLAAGIVAGILFKVGIGYYGWSFEHFWTGGSYVALRQLLTFGTLLLLFVPYVEYVLGVWNGAFRRTPVWSTIGWVPAGTIIGAFFGPALFAAGHGINGGYIRFELSGLLVGALVGLWLGVCLEFYVHRASSEREWWITPADVLQLVILIGVTIVLAVLAYEWYYITPQSTAVRPESW